MNPKYFFLIYILYFLVSSCQDRNTISEDKNDYVPVIASDWWRICEAQDLDTLNGPDPSRQHVIDHGFIQAANGKWQLWACMRGTAVGRLLYGWEGGSLTEGPWQPTGIKARAKAEFGEQEKPAEKIQAPYFKKIGDQYYCFYNSGGIRWMVSEEGVNYRRNFDESGSNLLYEKGGRDVMVLDIDGTYYAYSTVSTVARDGWLYGFIIVRTSQDFKRWSDYTIVAEGGKAGQGPVSAESPFVQEYKGSYYLFRASSVDGKTYVYRSDNPYLFCNNDDAKLITVLDIKAPEIIHHEGSWYISDLSDFKGIKLARLSWEKE